MKKVREYFI